MLSFILAVLFFLPRFCFLVPSYTHTPKYIYGNITKKDSQKQVKGMQATTGSVPEHAPPIWGVMKELQEGFNGHQCSLPYLLNIAQNLQRTLEETRHLYNNAIKQRDEVRAKLIAVQNSLAAVERVVSQYASVKDPVVASDGFTYENVSIREYLRECASTNTKAYSQLTKEELLDVVVPNQTLRRLVHMLQSVRTTEVPPITQRRPIPPYTPQQGDANWKSNNMANSGSNNGNGLNWADEEANPGSTPIRVAELEATLAKAANAGSLNASQSSNVLPPTVPTNNSSSNNNNNNTSNNNNSGTPGRRWETRQQQAAGHGSKNSNKKHPCLRVYGHCNFLEDCTFANYPYEACLNYIKGKCRFGQHCKELHVTSTHSRYPGQRKGSNNNQQANSGATPAQAEEKETNVKEKRATKDKDSSKNSSTRGETNSKESVEEQQEAKPTPTMTPKSETDARPAEAPVLVEEKAS
ncbi:RNA-binding protein, putative [Trypanosoma cruzi]|uniref:RNA-binding protein, putative n=2 Tax=Trypanosoma cruzi TaxID=5693 RepID=Q4DCC6_TRYCC|nr:RNA-binding protein, putative [Trypanosoma cruzi]EAN90180.1 RNA-binding protein, putative [Trypanosoma cruzi]|eukprot:XP_812031.1 RNA-binding protein [Trypanosoma cruzi strain CL Brener]